MYGGGELLATDLYIMPFAYKGSLFRFLRQSISISGCVHGSVRRYATPFHRHTEEEFIAMPLGENLVDD